MWIRQTMWERCDIGYWRKILAHLPKALCWPQTQVNKTHVGVWTLWATSSGSSSTVSEQLWQSNVYLIRHSLVSQDFSCFPGRFSTNLVLDNFDADNHPHSPENKARYSRVRSPCQTGVIPNDLNGVIMFIVLRYLSGSDHGVKIFKSKRLVELRVWY